MQRQEWSQNLGSQRFRHPEPPRRNWSGIIKLTVFVIILLAAIGGALWYFISPEEKVDINNLPVVEADNEPVKILPENAGKVDVPHQDKLVYNQVHSGDKKPQVEHLLAPPEEPIAIGEEHEKQQHELAEQSINDDVVEFKEVDHSKPVEQPKPAEQPKPIEPVKVEKPQESKQEEKKEEKKPEPVKSEAKPRFGVQIASAISLAKAKKEWSLITRKAPDLFNNQEVNYPAIKKDDKKTTIYRVQIGAFSEAGEAKELCRKMQMNKIKCRVVPYKK